MSSEASPLPRLRAVFEASKDFGLTEDEAWRILEDVAIAMGEDALLGDYADELVAALAGEILATQRRRLGGERRSSVSDAR